MVEFQRQERCIGTVGDEVYIAKRKLSDSDETEARESKTVCMSEDLDVVDLLETEQDNDSEGKRNSYYASIKCADPEKTEVFYCKYCSTNVQCIQANIVQCMMFGDYFIKDSHNVLLLYCWDCWPKDRVIAVYMIGRWWPLEDVLKSKTHKKNGWTKVTTFGERVVLFLLNRIIFMQWESEVEDVTYLSHTCNENAKLLWHNNHAIGFYTYKTKGTAVMEACPFVWEIPAIDTIFIRKAHRRQGFATSLLLDFLHTFPKQNIGLISPVSDAMMAVCYKFLLSNQEYRNQMWYCSPPGGEGYRGNLWLRFVSLRKEHKGIEKETKGSSQKDSKQDVHKST